MAVADADRTVEAWASADAELRAARKLRAEGFDVSPLDVATAARKRWKRSLTAERDARLAKGAGGSKRALRGHVTRQLLEDLRKDFTKRGLHRATPTEGEG